MRYFDWESFSHGKLGVIINSEEELIHFNNRMRTDGEAFSINKGTTFVCMYLSDPYIFEEVKDKIIYCADRTISLMKPEEWTNDRRMEWRLIKDNMFFDSEIKSGMVVETRDGFRYIVVNSLILINSSGALIFDVKINRSIGGIDDKDICKIFDFKSNKLAPSEDGDHLSSLLFDDNNLKILWDREKKKITMKDVISRFGCDVEIIDL